MAKKIFIPFVIILLLSAVGVALTRYSNPGKTLAPEVRDLMVLHDRLIQNRVLVVQLLTTDESQSHEINELLSYLENENASTLGLLQNEIKKESLSAYEVLLSKSIEIMTQLKEFTVMANKVKSADREEAFILLTDLTNLILEYRFELEKSGFQFPSLPPQPSQ